MTEKKQMFKRQEVLNILEDVLNEWYNLWNLFEKRLNDRWLNSWDWINEYLWDEFIEEFIDNLI